jgi:hypothetical protein
MERWKIILIALFIVGAFVIVGTVDYNSRVQPKSQVDDGLYTYGR